MVAARPRKAGTYPTTAQVPSSANASSISSYTNSSNSKTVGSGITRRPSENMLLNMAEGKQSQNQNQQQQQQQHQTHNPRSSANGSEESDHVLSFKPPNRKAVLIKNERPISNDSINTEGDVFSINAGSSKDSSRGTSIIDDDDDENHDTEQSAVLDGKVSANVMPRGKKSFSSVKQNPVTPHSSVTDGLDDVSHLTDTSFSDADLSVTTVKVASAPKSMNTKYIFNNPGSQGKSVAPDAFQSVDSSPKLTRSMFSTVNPTAMHSSYDQHSQLHGQSQPLHNTHPLATSLHSKSVPALPSDSLNGKKPLTPSQRYRLRREQNKLHLQHSIKQKELFYDEDAKLPANDLLDESLVWSIPTASHSSTFISQRKHRASVPNVGRSAKLLDGHDMPPSPIPGVQKVSDLEYFQQVGKNLSAVYQKLEYEVTKSKLLERTQSAELLPLDFKNASVEGMEDLKLVSDDKVSIISSTRPCWLPPKDTEERRSHERDVRKTLSMASIEKLETNQRRHEQEIKNETNNQKLVLLIDRGLNRKSSLQDLKKIAWETGFSSARRSFIYNTVLNTDFNIISTKYMDDTSSLDNIIRSKMTPFPSTQMAEINKLVDDMHFPVESQIRSKLIKLLQWKSISRFGLQTGDNYLMLHFLLEGYDLELIWKLANLLQLTCFNSITRDKYDNRIMNRDGVVGRYMRKDSAFAEEFDSRYLNYMTFWNCLARVDHDLFIWIMDIIVAENARASRWTEEWQHQLRNTDWDTFKEKYIVVNYKVLCSLSLNVLLRYHFGWNNLLHLDELPPSFQLVKPVDNREPVSDQYLVFIKKWNHYYAKF